MNNAQVLALIAAFLTFTVGSFIWYIATWQPKPATTGFLHSTTVHFASASPVYCPCITCASPLSQLTGGTV